MTRCVCRVPRRGSGPTEGICLDCTYSLRPPDRGVTDALLDICARRYEEWQATPLRRAVVRRRRFNLWLSAVARLQEHEQGRA